MHQEWSDLRPTSGCWPYSGATTSGRVALPACREVKGRRVSLKRFQWDMKPRDCLIGL